MSFYQACLPFIALLLWLNEVKWIKWPKPINLKLFKLSFTRKHSVSRQRTWRHYQQMIHSVCQLNPVRTGCCKGKRAVASAQNFILTGHFQSLWTIEQKIGAPVSHGGHLKVAPHLSYIIFTCPPSLLSLKNPMPCAIPSQATISTAKNGSHCRLLVQ